jgi:hypothetical protein
MRIEERPLTIITSWQQYVQKYLLYLLCDLSSIPDRDIYEIRRAGAHADPRRDLGVRAHYQNGRIGSRFFVVSFAGPFIEVVSQTAADVPAPLMRLYIRGAHGRERRYAGVDTASDRRGAFRRR